MLVRLMLGFAGLEPMKSNIFCSLVCACKWPRALIEKHGTWHKLSVTSKLIGKKNFSLSPALQL